jgi:hypothetical protein
MLGGSAGFALGAALLPGLAVVLALAIFDRQRRPQIEGWEETTAVGDATYFVPPSDSAAPALVSWDAGVLKVVTAERVKCRDTQMRRAGRDPATGVSIYHPTVPPHTAVAPHFHVKVAPGEYLPATP